MKAQASLEMECPQRLEIFLFNFRAEIILADQNQISFFKLDSTISFVLQVPLKEIVCFGEKCRQEVYFNFIARFWGLLEWYCSAYNEHLFVLHMCTNKLSLKQRNWALHGNKSNYCFEWGSPRKGMRDNNPNKVRLPLCLFLRQYAGSQNLHYWQTFFLYWQESLLCAKGLFVKQAQKLVVIDALDLHSCLCLCFVLALIMFYGTVEAIWSNIRQKVTKSWKH